VTEEEESFGPVVFELDQFQFNRLESERRPLEGEEGGEGTARFDIMK
jgi:hypothetical protein